MRVEHVRAVDFRCYERLAADLAPGLTVVCGANGAGKTSLLEAIHYACCGWSPRTGDDRRIVRTGATGFRAEVGGLVRAVPHRSSVAVEPGAGRRVTVDDAAATGDDLAALWVPLVFLPDRLLLITRAPALRRAYLDRALGRAWPPARATARAYADAVAQRNAYLRRVRDHADDHALQSWDDQVAHHGAGLVALRTRYVTALGPLFARRLDELGGGAGAVRYDAGVEPDPAALASALRACRDRDLRRRTTGAGPHLDDLSLTEDDRDLRAHGSQGEQRRALLALILAEADLLTTIRGDAPFLLLDDVLSELDRERRRRLLAAVAGWEQVLITTTESEAAASAELRLERGRVVG